MHALFRTALLGLALLCTAHAIDVVKIEVQTRRGTSIDPNYVLFNTRTQVGQELSRTLLAEDIRTLQRTGRFSMVRAEFLEAPDGLELIYVVQPRTNLRTITIEGNKKLSERKINKLIELERGDLIDETKVAMRLQLVEEEYKKKYYPEPEIISDLIVDEDTGAADLRIKVIEGERYTVKDIRFEGNTHFLDRQLRTVMEQKETWWFEWVSPKGQLDEGAAPTDQAKVRATYRGEGYLDVKVTGPKKVPASNPEHVDLVYTIVEGPRYVIGTVTLKGIKEFPVQQIRNLLPVKPGKYARMIDVENAAQTIRDYYGARGHVSTGVDTQVTPVAGKKAIVDLTFTVTEGRLARIRDVLVRGNSVTKDKVVRRELTFYPGEIYNEVQVKSSERKLRNTGLFSYVRATRHPTGTPDEYDVIVDVEEARTGQLLTGFGLSSTESLIGFVELRQNNFDIFNAPTFSGGGQKISIRAQLGTKREDIDITHVEPWFLNKKLRLTTRLFQNEFRFLSDDYDQRNIGGSMGISRALTDTWRTGLTYELEQVKVFNVSSNASELVTIEEGKQIQSSLTWSFTHDTRDRFFIPTRGNRTIISAKGAGGPLGFDVDIYELKVKSQQHVPMWYDHILSFQGHVRTVEEWNGADRVPIFDREFLGGARTIRGFDFREVGPKDEDGEPIGGKSDWWFTTEYTIPLAERLRFATFHDMGMVASDSYDWDFADFNNSVGVGLRIDIPQFPLQLDYSWPLEADEFNDRSSGRFSFLFGGTFQ